MKQVPDRKWLRREYLSKKSKIYGKTAFYSGVCVLLWVVVGYWLYFLPLYYQYEGWKEEAAIGLVSIVAAIWATTRLRHSEKEVKNLIYVPPVTLDTLPADEILVRGSEEPFTAQSEVLLRAAEKGQGTPKEELLRVIGE